MPLEPPVTCGLVAHADGPVPQKLYGCDSILQEFAARVRAAGQGAQQSVWLTGAAGAGKSALLQQVAAMARAADGLAGVGACDPIRRDAPFAAVNQAIAALMQQLLQQPPTAVAQWRARLQEALGPMGHALTQVFPAVEALVGKQKPLTQPSLLTAQNCLFSLTRRFLAALCYGQPVVMCLDNLQWADAATFNLLKLLARSDSHCAGLLVVGAYRGADTLPTSWLDELGPQAQRIALSPLPADCVAPWLDSTGVAPAAAFAWGAWLVAHSAGNPGFISLYVPQIRQGALPPPDWPGEPFGAAMLAAHLQRLPPHTAHLLQSAAFLGAVFTCDDLATVSAVPQAEVTAWMVFALEQAVLRHTAAGAYMFVHSLMQETATYACGEAGEARGVGARRLLAAQDPAHAPTWVFRVVENLNAAQSFATQDRQDLIALNQVAALSCQAAASYPLAQNYLQAAMGHAEMATPPDAFNFPLHLQWARCHQLLGETTQAMTHVEQLRAHSQTLTQKIQTHMLHLATVAATGDYPGAVQIGMDALHLLNVRMPRRPTRSALLALLGRLRWACRGRSETSLVQAAVVTDSRVILALAVLDAMKQPAFHCPETIFFGMVVLTMAALTMAHGNTPVSAGTYAALAVVYARLNRYAQARKFARVARKIQDIFVDSGGAGAVLCVNAAFVSYVNCRPRVLAERFAEAYEAADYAGDNVYAMWSCVFELYALAGESIALFAQKAARYEILIRQAGTALQVDAFLSRRQAIRCLTGGTRSPYDFSDDSYNEAHEQHRMGPAACATHHALRTQVLWIHGDAPAAIESATQAVTKNLFCIVSEHLLVTTCFFACLALIDVARTQPLTPTQQRLLSRFQVKLQAACQTDVYMGVLRLIDAEMAHLHGEHLAAMRLYERSIRELIASGYQGFTAAALECAGRYFVANDMQWLAEQTLQRAWLTYKLWGATVKLDLLAREHGSRLGATGARARQENDTQMTGGFAHEMRNALGSARWALAGLYHPETSSTLGCYEAVQAALGEIDRQLQAARATPQTDAQGNLLARLSAQLERLQQEQILAAQLFTSVRKGLDRGLQITSQILDYAQAGHLRAGDDAVAISHVVQGVLLELDESLRGAGIAVDTHLAQDVTVPMKHEHVYTIVRNLIVNARDALKHNEPDRLRRIVVQADVAHRGVVLTVEDTGMGMSRDTQSRVFEPFFTTKGAAGTGLGLGLSRKLAHVYGGELSFESQESQGTKFSLTLPPHLTP